MCSRLWTVSFASPHYPHFVDVETETLSTRVRHSHPEAKLASSEAGVLCCPLVPSPACCHCSWGSGRGSIFTVRGRGSLCILVLHKDLGKRLPFCAFPGEREGCMGSPNRPLASECAPALGRKERVNRSNGEEDRMLPLFLERERPAQSCCLHCAKMLRPENSAFSWKVTEHHRPVVL